MGFEAIKVGELARRTGLTIRTLHHYDAIGLLRPSQHSEAGYRLYTGRDVARLQQILSLRQVGFSLEEIKGCLDQPGFSLLEVIGLHVERLREQMEAQKRLCARLEAIAAHIRATEEVSVDELVRTIEDMTMLEKIQEKYFTPEQMQSFQAARERLGKETLEEKQQAWADLIAEVRAEMDRGTDPADAKVQALARRWQELIQFTTGGDKAIEQSIKKLWEEQGDKLAAQFGAQYDSRPVWGYITKALEAGKSAC